MSVKILQICSNLGMGGTQKAMQIIARNLDSDQFESHICGYERLGVRGSQLSNEGFPVFSPESRSDLEGYLEEENIDIIHLHGFDEWNSAKEIITAGDRAGVRGYIKTDNFGWGDRSKIHKKIDRYHLISDFCYHRYSSLNNVDMDKFKVVHYPLSDSDFEIKPENDKLLDYDGPVIGKIGRPVNGKWGNILIPAFAQALTEIPSLKLLLVGAPEKIKSQAHKHNVEENIEYIEKLYPDEVNRFYTTIDVLAHTSAIGESFGYVLAESMASKTPVIVNSTPLQDNAQVELIDNGVNGFVANSVESFSRAIVKLMSNPTLIDAFGEKAAVDAEDKYHVSTIIPKIESDYLAIYSDLDWEMGDENKTLQYDMKLDDHISGFELNYEVRKSLWKLLVKLPIGRKQLLYRILRRLTRP